MALQWRADIRETIASQTHLSITDWLFSIAHREYKKDDFIPTLVPSAIPKGVFNVFEGLAISYEKCKDADVTVLVAMPIHALFDGGCSYTLNSQLIENNTHPHHVAVVAEV
eukprot:COSAG02_NODE_30914_length_542_cov_4.474041_1_plen_111_part_00